MEKIYRKIFLISLFSCLIFISNVNAAARTNFTTKSVTPIDNYLSKNSGKTLNDFVDNMLKDFVFPSSQYVKSNYIITIDNSISSDKIRLNYLSSDFYQNIAYNYNSGSYALYFRNNGSGNFTYCYKDYTYNSNGIITNIGNWNCQSTNTWAVIGTKDYGVNYVISTNYSSFAYKSPTWNSYSFSIDGGTEYVFNNNEIPVNFLNGNRYNFEVSDYFNPVEPLNCTKSQVLGFLSNVSDFTFRIKGESNALSEPIRGQLQINYPSDITITDSDLTIDIVQFNDNEVDGSYKLNCPDDIKSCYIEYSYNYIDDITSEVDFGIEVTFNTDNLPRYIQLYNCFHNDMYDYYNVSYTYTNGSDSSSNNDSIISNFLQDGSEPDLDGLVDTSLIGDGPVDSILLLPLNIMNTLLNVLNSNTCQPLVLPLPFIHQNLTLPCISTIYSQINGLNVFLNWFSAIVSAFILYEYFIRLYKWVDDTLTFRENNHFGGF